MSDCSTNRAGFDRVLMAVAATFLAVSATSALAGPSDTPRASAAELAIDAAIPRPEPANVPPPSIGDFKMDSTASVPDATKALDKAIAKPSEPNATTATEPDTKPAEIVTAPAKANDTATTPPPAATTTPATPTAPAAAPAREHAQRARVRTPRGTPRSLQATSPRPISRLPTDCAKCWPQNRCAILIARTSARPSRNSTQRVSTRRCGPRPEN